MMHKTIAFLIAAMLCIVTPAVNFAAITPSVKSISIRTPEAFTDSMMLKITSLPAKEIEKITHYHLTLKERFALKLLHHKLETTGNMNLADSTGDEKIERQALWAKWLGIGSLVGIFIPGVDLLCFPAAITAIVFGAGTIKKTKHPKYSRQGIGFGIATLALFLLIGFIVLLVTYLPVR